MRGRNPQASIPFCYRILDTDPRNQLYSYLFPLSGLPAPAKAQPAQ
jgi:hypothetical protein